MEKTSKVDKEMLKVGWIGLWTRLGAKGDPMSVFNALAEAYSNGRAYHNLSHIEACLEEVGMVRGKLADPLAVEFALWFHDAVYDTRRQDNEERSAEWAATVARNAGLGEEFSEKVRKLILVTKHFSATDNDAQYLADIDLSILGQSAAQFDTYDAGIAAEYSWVPSAPYRNGRAGVLRHFAQRDHIFTTKTFQEIYEQRAKSNIERTVATLEEGKKKIMGVYAGSFDPPTVGHEWMISKGAMLFDNLVVTVAVNPAKRCTFTADERKEMLLKIVGNRSNVTVTVVENDYTARYAKSIGAGYLLRGVRRMEDYSQEQQLADINRTIEPNVETVLLTTPPELAIVSSSLVRGLIGPKGWQELVRKYVAPEVFEALLRKFDGGSR